MFQSFVQNFLNSGDVKAISSNKLSTLFIPSCSLSSSLVSRSVVQLVLSECECDFQSFTVSNSSNLVIFEPWFCLDYHGITYPDVYYNNNGEPNLFSIPTLNLSCIRGVSALQLLKLSKFYNELKVIIGDSELDFDISTGLDPADGVYTSVGGHLDIADEFWDACDNNILDCSLLSNKLVNAIKSNSCLLPHLVKDQDGKCLISFYRPCSNDNHSSSYNIQDSVKLFNWLHQAKRTQTLDYSLFSSGFQFKSIDDISTTCLSDGCFLSIKSDSIYSFIVSGYENEPIFLNLMNQFNFDISRPIQIVFNMRRPYEIEIEDVVELLELPVFHESLDTRYCDTGLIKTAVSAASSFCLYSKHYDHFKSNGFSISLTDKTNSFGFNEFSVIDDDFKLHDDSGEILVKMSIKDSEYMTTEKLLLLRCGCDMLSVGALFNDMTSSLSLVMELTRSSCFLIKNGLEFRIPSNVYFYVQGFKVGCSVSLLAVEILTDRLTIFNLFNVQDACACVDVSSLEINKSYFLYYTKFDEDKIQTDVCPIGQLNFNTNCDKLNAYYYNFKVYADYSLNATTFIDLNIQFKKYVLINYEGVYGVQMLPVKRCRDMIIRMLRDS